MQGLGNYEEIHTFVILTQNSWLVTQRSQRKDGSLLCKKRRNSFLEKERMTLLGMKDDDLDDALYNLKVQAVNLVTDALPWLLFGIGAVVVIQLLA